MTKLTAFLNKKDFNADRIMEMLERTGIKYFVLPTSGPCKLWVKEKEQIPMMYTGPTAIGEVLSLYVIK